MIPPPPPRKKRSRWQKNSTTRVKSPARRMAQHEDDTIQANVDRKDMKNFYSALKTVQIALSSQRRSMGTRSSRTKRRSLNAAEQSTSTTSSTIYQQWSHSKTSTSPSGFMTHLQVHLLKWKWQKPSRICLVERHMVLVPPQLKSTPLVGRNRNPLKPVQLCVVSRKAATGV